MKKKWYALSVLCLVSAIGLFGAAPDSQETAPIKMSTAKSYIVPGSITRGVLETETKSKSICGVEKKDDYSNVVVPLAKEHGIDWRLVTAIMAAESSFNPCALSPKGAMGLMQIMPAVAKEYKVSVAEAFQPDQNIKAGILLLKRLNKKYKGNLKLTVAAYNAGQGNVTRYKGIPPFKETRNYVKKVLGYHSDLKMAKATPTSGSPMKLLKAR